MTKKLLIFSLLSLIAFTGSAQCPKPYQLSTNTKTTNSITLTWNSGNNSLTGNFEIEYGPANFSRGTGTKVYSSYIAVQINNLASNTPYDFYVTNRCGSTPTTSDIYSDTTTADYCNGDLFLDPGFENNYVGTYHESYSLATNTTNTRVSLSFDSFQLSPDATLTIWDGSYSIGTPLAVFDQNVTPTEPIVSKSSDGELYAVFESNNSQNSAPGWIGRITCVDKPKCTMPRFFSTSDITYNSIAFRWSKSTANRTLIEYGPKGFEIGTGIKVETYSNTITISNLTELTEYDFYLTEECDDLSLSDINRVSFSTKAYCEPNISFGRLEAYELNQIKIHNVNFQLNESWQVEYGLKGFTPGEGMIENFSTTEAIIGNLESDKEYDFYFRNKCGERYGESIGPYSKKTNIDYCSEGKIYDRGGKDGIYTDYQRTRDLYVYIHDNTRARLKFNYVSLPNYEEIKVYDGPDSNSPLLKRLWRTGYSTNFVEFVSSGSSNVLFFEMVTNRYYSDIKWDLDITCETTPNCEEVGDFKVNPFKLTHNQCELTWINTLDVNDSYIIEYGLEGFERGTGIILNTDENFIILSNLDKETIYQAYITTACALGGQDNVYAKPVTFKTTPDYFGGDKFTDDGGTENNIPENQTEIITLYPKAERERIRLNFDYIDLLTNSYTGSLKLYSGIGTDSPPMVQLYNSNDFTTQGSSFYSDDPNGALTIEFMVNSSYVNYYSRGWEADVISELIPDCDEPFNISTTRFTHQEINLAWESEIDVTEWQIEYGPASFVKGSGIVTNTTDKNILISGLSPDTEYDFYIFSKCSTDNYNYYTPAYKQKTRKDFSSGAILTSNDGVSVIYPDNVNERIRFEFTNFSLQSSNSSYNKSQVVVNFKNDLKSYNYYSCYDFYYDSNLFYPMVSEKEDGSISIIQNIDGTSYWEAKVISEPKPTCQITNEKQFLFQRVSNTEVELIWAKNDENITYKVEYGPIGFTLGTGIIQEFDSNRQFLESELRRPYHTYNTENNRFDENLIYYSMIFDNLQEDSEYEFYITTICPDGFVNIYPVPKLVKTTPNLVSTGIYHGNSSGEMRKRKVWTILGQLENTTICPNSTEDRIEATIKRLEIPQYTGGDPFTIFDHYNTKDESKVIFSRNWDINYYDDPIVVSANNDTGCLTFNFSHANSTSWSYLPKTLEQFDNGFGYKGWIVEITSVPKSSLSLEDIDNIRNIQLYPNPSNNYFYIKNNLSSEIKEVTINDISGRPVEQYFNTNFNQKLYFNLPSGIYFVNIETKNNTKSVQKIIVK